MKANLFTHGAILLFVAAAVIFASGCNQSGNEPTGGTTPVADATNDDDDGDGAAADAGWWCTEHGIPEEECSMCSTKVAAAFKAKDDWCEEHNRAESQCFICHPELKAKFAALYVAKYGKQPPEPKE